MANGSKLSSEADDIKIGCAESRSRICDEDAEANALEADLLWSRRMLDDGNPQVVAGELFSVIVGDAGDTGEWTPPTGEDTSDLKWVNPLSCCIGHV